MYFSTASKRPRELRAEDIALYWMDGNSPVAFVERGERISSNRSQTVQFKMDGDVILGGDRNRTGDALSLDIFENPAGDLSSGHWNVRLGPPANVEFPMLQWSFRDLEFLGVEQRPGTVRRLDETHLRNETGRTFRQAIYLDKSNVYFLNSVADGSQIDLAAATKKPLDRVAGSSFFTNRYPNEIADVTLTEIAARAQASAQNANQNVTQEDLNSAVGLTLRPFDLVELVRGWPANGGHAFDARSGLFFGLADEVEPPCSFPGKRFTTKGYSITIVSYAPKP